MGSEKIHGFESYILKLSSNNVTPSYLNRAASFSIGHKVQDPSFSSHGEQAYLRPEEDEQIL